jgi:hypothetical protein
VRCLSIESCVLLRWGFGGDGWLVVGWWWTVIDDEERISDGGI